MKLQPMKYGEYVWPHNPEHLTVSCRRAVRELQAPFAGSILQDYGVQKRVVEGEGEFYGADCIGQFQKLYGELEKTERAVLTLPNVPPFLARFVTLELIGNPEPDLVRYHFVFWEDGAAETAGNLLSGQVHECREGDDLWRIAAYYSVTVQQLLDKNPAIRWPNYLREGERVVIP